MQIFIEARQIPVELCRELLDIARKWRSKATMRETRIESLEQELREQHIFNEL